MLGETNDYIRKGFSLKTKCRKPNQEVFGFDRSVTDTMCALDAIKHGLIEADGIRLTAKGFNLLCYLKS